MRATTRPAFFATLISAIATAWFASTVPATAASANVQLIGRNPLYGRGMNAALAIYDHFVYIGNRTDSSSTCVGKTGEPSGATCVHPHPGILIVDVRQPSRPKVVGELGRPYAGNLGITTRELRVWPQKRLLIVMNFRCSRHLHACASGTDAQFPFDISFFDLLNPLKPRFLTHYVPTSRAGVHVKPHEMFLWTDPDNSDRALLYISTPTTSKDPSLPNLIVADISRVADGQQPVEVAEGNWNDLFPGTNRPDYPTAAGSQGKCGPYDCNLFVHSMGLTADGTRTFLAMEAGQFLVLNTAALAQQATAAQHFALHDDLVTQPANRPIWGQTPADPSAVPDNCRKACANGHSAVKVPGRSLVLTTDEVYGTYTDPAHGCPWGWEHLIDISDQSHPKIVGEFKTSQDDQTFCGSPAEDASTEQYTSYSSHNPTVLRDLAIVAWHSNGLQITDISDAAHPIASGFYAPTPLRSVAIEDPALNRGASKVTFWSYPILKDGLIYVIDIRNGLYILRYTGPHSDEVRTIRFLEGNSNLGDALRLDTAVRR
ncbi:MAG: hypothetical protein JO193_05655 [Candidatus Eremiobacteraeota bacterium]|nr:hypothetical protein [Candidatus Eremiobacteraeota bacterium]